MTMTLPPSPRGRSALFAALLVCATAAIQSVAAAADSGWAVRWGTWAALQAVPSPALLSDRGSGGTRLIGGLRWHITPLNWSWSANRMVSPLQVLFVNPVRRYGGSVELFADPEWGLTSYRYSRLARFALGTGARAYLPLDEYGEYLSVSAGARYLIRKDLEGTSRNAWGVEAGLHTLFGIVGLKGTWQFGTEGGYSIGLVLRYY
jgi:hypothetical protein